MSVLERLERWPANFLAVLTYHRVADREPVSFPNPLLISAEPDEFAGQMDFLAERFHVVSAEELLAVRRGHARLAPRSVMLTFDDAYRDFGGHAWPIMRARGLPVTLFVPTAFPDRPELTFWWDRLYHALQTTPHSRLEDETLGEIALATGDDRLAAYRRLREMLKAMPHGEAIGALDRLAGRLQAPAPASPTVLGWSELRELAAQGVTLAPHSQTHPLLDRSPPDRVEAEVAGSLADLETKVGRVPRLFAYPSGGHDDAVVGVLERAGFEAAFTTERGVNDLRRPDWLRLRRIHVGSRSTLPVIRAQLLPSLGRVTRVSRRRRRRAAPPAVRASGS